MLRDAERIVQFPYNTPVTEEKTEEDLLRIAERRKEQGRKLQEIAAKARMDKVRSLSRSIRAFAMLTLNVRDAI